jgi:hypothetical protein
MIQILFILSIVAAAKIFVDAIQDVNTFMGRHDRGTTDIGKPLGCWKCMAFWMGLCVGLAMGEYYLIFCPYLFALILNKYLWS